MTEDFRRLWAAYSVSELGTALSLGALPLIATLVLHASVLQVSLLAALGRLRVMAAGTLRGECGRRRTEAAHDRPGDRGHTD